MQFLHPSFLWALAAITIPVVIHLFNFRRFKTVYFSNVKFLREVKEETASRSRLKHLLVLAARILAITFLVLAFAQPYLPNKNQHLSTGKKYVSVYLDNSFSMNAVSGGRSLLDKARQAAREIAKNYSADDQFQLLSNDFEGRQQRLVGKEEFITMVDEVEISPAVRNLAEISRRQKDALSHENGQNKIAYLLSDFQKNMGGFAADSSIHYNLIPLAADAAANVYIDTCWFNEPVQLLNQQATLVVRITNSGEKAVENNRLVLKLNGQTKSMGEVNIEPGSFVYDTLGFLLAQSGWNRAELSISDYPITYDDNYFLAFPVVEKIKVLAVNDGGTGNKFLTAMFKAQPEFDFTTVGTNGFTPEMLQGNQMVILDNLKSINSTLTASLGSYVAAGGALVVFPGANADVEAYNRLLNSFRANSITDFIEQQQDLAPINWQQNIFKDVFERVPDNMNLPSVKKYYAFAASTASNEEAILTLKSGGSFFSRYPHQAGSVYVCASPLDNAYSDLPVHAIFVPMLYKMAVMNIHTGSISYFIGDKVRIETEAPKTAGDKIYKIKGEDVEFIPEQLAVGNKMLLGLNDQVKKAGFYNLVLENTAVNDWLALNFDRRESALQFFTAEELKTQYNGTNVTVVNGANTEVASVMKELNRGTPLWKWCIILALLFLAIEILLLRFWKV